MEISLNILIFLIFNNIRIFSLEFCVVFSHKNIKNVSCNENKNASVGVFICMYSMDVQLFTAFEEAVLKLYVSW